MNMKSIRECEQGKLERFMNFKFPNYVKKIGWAGVILSFIVLIATKFFDGDLTILKLVLKRFVLASLLLVVLSKEKIEDERIQQFRAKAFSFTFLAAVLYVLVQPIINFLVASVVEPEDAIFEDLGDFVIVWFFLCIYLMFFKLLKRAGS
jgi:hypothetical protein